jgi:hypothetical protein
VGGPDTSRKEHERGFAEFVAPPIREKYRTAFNTPKKRAKLADDLAHDNPFDDGCIVRIFTEDVTADAVYGELKERGATRTGATSLNKPGSGARARSVKF